MEKYRKQFVISLHLLFSVILIVPASAQTETYTWNNVAIGGGGFVSGIITSKTEQNLIYARTDVGGAYRWDAANARWIPLLDWVSENELGYLGVESMAIDPVETNKVYMLVGTAYFNNGKTAILRSADYGNTFSITDVTNLFKAHGNGMGRQTGEKLVVDPNDPGTLYCGTRADGLFKSVDAGVSWTHVAALNVTTTPNANGISFVVLDPGSGATGTPSQTIIAGVSRTGSNLYRSDDGGTTFMEIPGSPGPFMPHRAVLTSAGDLFITYADKEGPWNVGNSNSGAIWKYNLQSGSWTDVTPAGFSRGFGGISVDPANAQRIVASSIGQYLQQDGAWGDRIFLSTDGGTSWTDVIGRGVDMDPNGSPWIEGHAMHWTGSVEFDPFDTKKVWVISGNGVFRTDDIDANVNVWKFTVEGMEETVPLDIVSIPNGPLVSVIGDYDGFRHTDVSTYAPIHAPQMGTTTGVAYASLNPSVMLRVGVKMYYSTDSGITWTETTKNGDKGSVAIAADGSVFLHCAEGTSAMYRSVDNGASWTMAGGVSVTNARPVADPVNPARFYVYDNNTGSLLTSTNGGVSFSAAGSPGAGGSSVIRAAPGREGDIWVALYGSGLTRSVNTGQRFTKLNNVTYCGAVGFGKEAPGKTYPTVYIWGRVGGVLGIHRSVDEGATWLRVNDDTHEYGGPGNGQFVIGDRNVFGRVYMSTAGRGIVYGESDETCIPTPVIPYVKVNDGPIRQAAMVSVNKGSAVMFSPEPAQGGSWLWRGPGGFTAADRAITLTNIQRETTGIYTAVYTNAAGCESAAQTFTVNMPEQSVTTIEQSLDARFGVYPNPVHTELYIKDATSIKRVNIMDLRGGTVKAIINHENSMTISATGIPAGMYILELIEHSNRKHLKRIIKY